MKEREKKIKGMQTSEAIDECLIRATDNESQNLENVMWSFVSQNSCMGSKCGTWMRNGKYFVDFGGDFLRYS